MIKKWLKLQPDFQGEDLQMGTNDKIAIVPVHESIVLLRKFSFYKKCCTNKRFWRLFVQQVLDIFFRMQYLHAK
jgi:hypothetical protein